MTTWLSGFVQCAQAACQTGVDPLPQKSWDTNAPQDLLTGKTWLSISQLNRDCTCHGLLDKLWLASVHQASELWKPLMDEIWTSIFLRSCLLNKLPLKFIAMFADMCCRECSYLPEPPHHHTPSAQVIFWVEGNKLREQGSELQWQHGDILWRPSGLMRVCP